MSLGLGCLVLATSSRMTYHAVAMLESLPHIPLFDNLDSVQSSLLKGLFEAFVCPSNAIIFEQGEIASYLYWLIKGEATIRYKPYDGPALILTHLRADDVFGWSAALGNRYYTSSVISETQVQATRIRGSHLCALLREHPDTGKIVLDRFMRAVSPRWEGVSAQIQSILNSSQQ